MVQSVLYARNKDSKSYSPLQNGPHVVMDKPNQGRRYEAISATSTPAPVGSCRYSLSLYQELITALQFRNPRYQSQWHCSAGGVSILYYIYGVVCLSRLCHSRLPTVGDAGSIILYIAQTRLLSVVRKKYMAKKDGCPTNLAENRPRTSQMTRRSRIIFR